MESKTETIQRYYNKPIKRLENKDGTYHFILILETTYLNGINLSAKFGLIYDVTMHDNYAKLYMKLTEAEFIEIS